MGALVVALIALAALGLVVSIVSRKTGPSAGHGNSEPEVNLRGSEVSDVQTPSTRTARTSGESQELVLGGVPIEPNLEFQHFLFAGATGSGKTQGINLILAAARARGARAIVVDAGGEALSHFFREGDLILNPLDARSVAWSPFAEIREPHDCDRLAKAVIPDGVGNNQEWNHYSQTLMAELLRSMSTFKLASTDKLRYLLTAAPVSELEPYLKGTSAQMFCQNAADKMLGSVRVILGSYMTAWPSLADKGTFSVRDWLRADDQNGWLFVTHRDDQIAFKRLIGAWLDLAIVEGLTLDVDKKREIWFVMDEVDSLGQISSLRHALSKLRKYGCKCVLGLQTVAQLRATYGEHEAQTLMGNIGTKVILRAGDGQTAEYFSAEIGSHEIERAQHGTSKSRGPQYSSSDQTTSVRETKRTILDSEISGLKDLHGFLKMPGELRKITLVHQALPRVTEPFVPKPRETTAQTLTV